MTNGDAVDIGCISGGHRKRHELAVHSEYLNPSIEVMSSTALEEFQQHLEALTPSGTGSFYLTNVDVDPNSTDATPLFDVEATGAANEELSAGAGFRHDYR